MYCVERHQTAGLAVCGIAGVRYECAFRRRGQHTWRLSMEGPKQESELEAYDDSVKYSYLLEELHTSRDLLRYGFQHLKEVNVSMTMHDVPQQLLASGLERLMKYYIALIYKSRNGSFPNDGYMKMFGA